MVSKMEQKWLEIKGKLDGMSDVEFEEMIERNGHYDIGFAEEILCVEHDDDFQNASLEGIRKEK